VWSSGISHMGPVSIASQSTCCQLCAVSYCCTADGMLDVVSVMRRSGGLTYMRDRLIRGNIQYIGTGFELSSFIDCLSYGACS